MRAIGFIALLCVSIGLVVAYLGAERLNSGTALHRMKQIREGQARFKGDYGHYGTLSELANADLIPASIVDEKAWGYIYSVETDGETYRATALPSENSINQSAGVSFYLDDSAVIRISLEDLIPANSLSDPLPQ